VQRAARDRSRGGVVDVVSHLSAVVDDTDDMRKGYRAPVVF
jgi:hypothetical protein